MPDHGRIAYRGFEYQIHATAWLLLSWLLERRLGDTAEVEPLSGEDLELLGRDDHTKDASHRATGLQAQGGASRYIVQIKGRSIGDWAKGELHGILAGAGSAGGAQDPHEDRIRPLDVLKEDPDARFLFVTDGVLAKGLSALRVDDPWFEPREVPANNLPACLAQAPDTLRARVGVLQQVPLPLIRAEADRILRESLHVSHAKRKACAEAIVSRIRKAMSARSRGRIAAGALRSVVDEYGLPAEPEPFAKPAVFGRVRQMLERQHVVVLLGEPGVGKTRAADRLVMEHRARAEPFAIETFHHTDAPAALRQYRGRTEPHLLFVSDPFGYYQQDPRSREWLVEIEALCDALHSDLRLIVTSRTSFAMPLLEDDGAPRLRRHIITIKEEHFDGNELLRAHLAHAKTLDGAAREWIENHAPRIVRTLSRPLSYRRLLDLARDVPPASRTGDELSKILRTASVAELGRDLLETFRDVSQAERAGLAAAWLALETWSRRPGELRSRLERLEDDLTGVGAEVVGVVEELRAHRWLRVRDGLWEMHPEYLRYCYEAVAKHHLLVRQVAERAIAALLERNDLESVAAMWRALDGRDLLKDAVTGRIRDVTRTLFVTSAAGKYETDVFVSALTLLGTHGDVGHPVDALAMAIVYGGAERYRHRHAWGGHSWRPPRWSEATRAAVRSDPATESIVRAFVRNGFPMLPSFLVEGEEELVDFLYEMTDVSSELSSTVGSEAWNSRDLKSRPH